MECVKNNNNKGLDGIQCSKSKFIISFLLSAIIIKLYKIAL